MVEFTVNDMTCGHCASRVTQAIKAVDADAKVTIDVAKKYVGIDSTHAVTELTAALAQAGYPPVPR